MNHEKQKVIRVLKPSKKNQKTQKMSSIYLGAAALTVGIFSLAVVIFSGSKNDSELSNVEKTSIKSLEKQQMGGHITSELSIHTRDNPQLASNRQDDQAQDDFNQPQPKLNEITNIFKHQKATIPPENLNASPFDNAFAQTQLDKPTAKVAAPHTQPKLNLPKPNEQAKVVKKPTEKKVAITPIAPPAPAVKVKESAKDPEVESPRATVQITVTKSLQEN